ncbi:MAG: family 16 glycosylhydrolase [Granulosicoccus sp.]
MTNKLMKQQTSLLATAFLALTVAACSSDSNPVVTPVNDPTTPTTGGDTTGGGTTGVDEPTTTGGGTTGVDEPGTTGGGTTGVDEPGTTGGGTTGVDEPGTTGGGTTGVDEPGTTGGGTTTGAQIPNDDAPRPDTPDLPDEQVPALPDPLALPIPGTSLADPFNALLEIDNEMPTAGGPPTQPKNLRLDLVSNDWAEISWAPSNDDGTVVQYNIERSDGVIYTVREDHADPAQQPNLPSGSLAEADKIWKTTSFIDCNFTRFFDQLHNCVDNQPEPGRTYTYLVTAVDDEGQESAASEPLSITYLEERNAPVPRYDDIYKGANDSFAQDNDLSAVDFWLDDFDLVFADEFNGTAIDSEKWNTGLTWGDTRIINGEQQYFVNTQVDPDFGYDPFEFTGESMIINAVPVPDDLRANLPPVCDEIDPTGLDRCEFLSGALSTHDKFQFIYGYTEGRFKVSGTPGALSSFYLYHRYAGNDLYHHAPEIDIIEYLGENPFGDPDAFQTYHFGDTTTQITRSAPTMSYKRPNGGTYADNNEWHTFGVLWEPSLVIWYIDGVEVKRLFGPQVSRQPMNIVNYLVAGSGWAPTPDASNPDLFPIQFEADYIRVYQRDEYKSTATFGQ